MLTEWASDGVRADLVLTDPPYHLASIAKRFGKEGSAPAQYGRDGAAARLSRGFMGYQWDGGTTAFEQETWSIIRSILKPGGRALIFGGTRTFWRVAAAAVAAGFEYEDTIIWAYGQGLVLRKSRMKPCFEPILVMRTPGPVRDLHIDECRTEENRWPSNLIHDNSSDVLACFPDSPGQLAAARRDGASKGNKIYGEMKHGGGDYNEPRHDTGSAARFFNSFQFTEIEQNLLYHAKAGAKERISRCGICNVSITANELRLHIHEDDSMEHITAHATVKPLSLLRHLVRLASKPGATIIDPFVGTGSTLEAATLEGRDAMGIDADPLSCRDTLRRMARAGHQL